MYFWKLDSLKRDLIAGAVGEKDRLRYLLWLGGVTTAAYAVPVGESNAWDHVESGVMVLGFIFGTVYLYQRNHGSSGRDFLTRYVSLNWVFGIRFAVLVAIPVFVATVGIESLLAGGIQEDSTPVESAVLAMLEVAYYLSLGHHLAGVASSRVAA